MPYNTESISSLKKQVAANWRAAGRVCVEETSSSKTNKHRQQPFLSIPISPCGSPFSHPLHRQPPHHLLYHHPRCRPNQNHFHCQVVITPNRSFDAYSGASAKREQRSDLPQLCHGLLLQYDRAGPQASDPSTSNNIFCHSGSSSSSSQSRVSLHRL